MSNMKSSIFDKLYNVCVSQIEVVTPNDLSKKKISLVVEEAIRFLKQPKDYEFKDKLILQLLENFTVKSSTHAIIKGKSDHVDWYDSTKDRPYWETYREYIKNDLQYSPDAVAAMDKTTDLMMKSIEDPNRDGFWDSRGLVVGSVQSGKTSNFIGFLNKAVDAGYKKIIVLSGLNNNLRQQTQIRVDEGLLAYDTQASSLGTKIYQGPLAARRMNYKLPIISCGTNSKLNGDFKKNVADNLNFHTDDPAIFVVKKNKSVLEKLIGYYLSSPKVHGVTVEQKPFKVRGHFSTFPPFIKDKPILIIDDEVDNGSVDTGEQLVNEEGNFDLDYDPKTINRLIRTLLNIFDKRVYIGYTATPFANIFIHNQAKTNEEGLDLFPKDYIIDLPIPSNHVGLEKIFNTEIVDGEQVQDREIDDNHFFQIVEDSSLFPDDPDCSEGWMPPRHDRYHQPEYNNKNDPEIDLPPSLKEAIISFILTSACRNFRGYVEDAKSMLIHVTKFVDVQDIVYKQVNDYLFLLRNRINKDNEKYEETISTFKKIWEEKFYIYKDTNENKYPSWSELINDKRSLDFVINQICQNIKVLNGRKNDTLEYKRFKSDNGFGLHTIIIGGDKLSRGLTLEGLSISYFLRSAKMPMYDTLMQMGRWFGYRMGYQDLCRLYTTDNVIRWFFHISVATEELRNAFRIMAAQGSTPSEFGLKVRTNPNLIITSKTKMRHSRVEQTSFSQEVEEIITFVNDDEVIKSNFISSEKLLGSISDPVISGEFENDLHRWKNIFLWKNVDPEKIINYLNTYKRFEEQRSLGTSQFARYIENLNNYNELTNWTVCLHGNGSSGQNLNISDKHNVELILRTPSNQRNKKKISLKVITQPTDELLGLEGDELKAYKDSLENFTKTHDTQTEEQTITSAKRGFARYHRSEKRGLLNLYPILGIKNLSSFKKFKGYKNCKSDCEKNCKKHVVKGHNDINKIDKDHLTKYPLMGFQISFPYSRMGDKAAVEYRVNSVYAEHELSNEI